MKTYIASEQTQSEIRDLAASIDGKMGKSGGGIMPHISLKAPTGSTVKITNGNTSLTPTEIDGVWEQDVPHFGTWNICIEKDGENPVSKDVEVISLSGYAISLSFFAATIVVKTPIGTVVTVSGNGNTQTATNTTGTNSFTVNASGDYTVSCNRDGNIKTENVAVSEKKTYTVSVKGLFRYGYRKKKSEGSPSARVEYLFDAVGMTPAAMDFSNGVFNFGSWGDMWFVTGNKPLMLKSDGTVDYYLDPSDYTKKEDGSASDVSNTNYDGNAMAQFPLAYFYRYQDDTYEYEIVSDGPYDENYKAYAHTRADGSIADFFYRSCFGASGSASKLRSLKGQALAQSLTTDNQIAGATANNNNGSSWYIDTWSQREYIRTLLVLMGKSTNTQAIFGNGNCQSASSASALLTTGTLSDKGQFFGYNSNNKQVKVFHIEGFWGDQWLRTAGIINNNGPIYYKMTPEGSGYRVTDVTGYNNSGITLSGTSGGYISATRCGEFGCIPTTISGSDSTYECDGSWFNNSQLDYLIAGACAYDAPGMGGAFAFNVNSAPSNADLAIGCGLSCEQPAAA